MELAATLPSSFEPDATVALVPLTSLTAIAALAATVAAMVWAAVVAVAAGTVTDSGATTGVVKVASVNGQRTATGNGLN